MTQLELLEKRLHRHIRSKLVLRISEKDQEVSVPDWTVVTSRNLSTNAVIFNYKRPLFAGMRLDVRIHFPEKTIRCEAYVVRSRPGSIEPLVQIVAKLTDLLKKYIADGRSTPGAKQANHEEVPLHPKVAAAAKKQAGKAMKAK